MRPKAKREVRWREVSSNPVDTGATTSKNPKIRVLNHKDYKTWRVRTGSFYAYSIITGFFLAIARILKDAAKPKYICAQG